MAKVKTRSWCPAPWNRKLFPYIIDMLGPIRGKVLDCFAGTGRIHELVDYGYDTIGVDIEPEGAKDHPRTEVGNALKLRFRAKSIAAVVISVTFGNRMADHHEAKDVCTHRVNGVKFKKRDCPRCEGKGGLTPRNTYRHRLGRKLHPDNSGGMQWGPEYQEFERKAMIEIMRVLKPGAPFILNIKDHIRQGKIIKVTDWHVREAKKIGFVVEKKKFVRTTGVREGANHKLRIDGEWIILFRKAA